MLYNAGDKRLRGRAGQEQRKRRLAAEPLCRHCAEKGIVRAATSPDHIVPLKMGGSDDDSNIQCLCEECHATKTALESTSSEAASNHPDWLKPSAIPLTIISGPPCAGKTTYVEQHSRPGDLVIDLDAILASLDPSYRQWSGGTLPSLLNRGIRARNELLGSLHRVCHGKAWFIVSAPTKAERDWWVSKLGGELVLLDPGTDECKRRAVARGTPLAAQGIDQWHRASLGTWSPPKRKAAAKVIGVDGWPVN